MYSDLAIKRREKALVAQSNNWVRLELLLQVEHGAIRLHGLFFETAPPGLSESVLSTGAK